MFIALVPDAATERAIRSAIPCAMTDLCLPVLRCTDGNAGVPSSVEVTRVWAGGSVLSAPVRKFKPHGPYGSMFWALDLVPVQGLFDLRLAVEGMFARLGLNWDVMEVFYPYVPVVDGPRMGLSGVPPEVFLFDRLEWRP